MRSYARFALAVLVTNLLVILWGAYVRISGSGAGCGAHWPLCNGAVVPREPSVQTLVELTHRATSGVAFILVFVSLVWAYRGFGKGHEARKASTSAMVFMVLEAAVGAGLVLLELVADNASAARAGWIAIHLVNTFLLVGSLVWTVLAASSVHVVRPSPTMLLVGLLLILTGVSGAITALGDTLFPAGSLADGMAQDLDPTAHFLIRLRIVHPALAVLTALVAFAVAGMSVWTGRDAVERLAAKALLLGLVLQLGVGVVNLVLLAPPGLQLLHLLVADLVWIAFVVFAVGRQRDGAP